MLNASAEETALLQSRPYSGAGHGSRADALRYRQGRGAGCLAAGKVTVGARKHSLYRVATRREQNLSRGGCDSDWGAGGAYGRGGGRGRPPPHQSRRREEPGCRRSVRSDASWQGSPFYSHVHLNSSWEGIQLVEDHSCTRDAHGLLLAEPRGDPIGNETLELVDHVPEFRSYAV